VRFAFVVEVEVEIGADRGLAIGDADRVLQLHGLVEAGPVPWSDASCGDQEEAGWGRSRFR
jgi:hypothetical protein